MDRPAWEPPLAGSEAEHLVGSLDRLRATFRWKADGLDSVGLATTVGASTLTLGGLLKHLAFVEDLTMTWKFDESSPGEPWVSIDWDEEQGWDFRSAATDAPQALYDLWDQRVALNRERLARAIEAGGLDQRVATGSDDGEQATLRRLLCDLIEEYGRHTGHADLIREAVDGRVGEDPDPEWILRALG